MEERATAKEILNKGKSVIQPWINSANEKEIREFIANCSPSNNYWKMANVRLSDLHGMNSRKPHWTTWLALGISVIALGVSIASWLAPRVQKNESKEIAIEANEMKINNVATKIRKKKD